MQTKLLIATLLLSLLTVFSCNSVDDAEKFAKSWSKQKRDKIIVDNMTTTSKAGSDTVQLTRADGELIDILAGGLWNNNDSVTKGNEEETYIIRDRDDSYSYEIRKWKNGDRSFNGIKINEQYQGWCEWFYKNGNILKEGTYVDNTPVGTWYYYSPSGQLDSSASYGNTELIYSKLKP